MRTRPGVGQRAIILELAFQKLTKIDFFVAFALKAEVDAKL